MLNYNNKVKLALESMEVLFKKYLSNECGLGINPASKPIFENWSKLTTEPITKDKYHQMVLKSIDHLFVKNNINLSKRI
jgi:hypothetical protein